MESVCVILEFSSKINVYLNALMDLLKSIACAVDAINRVLLVLTQSSNVLAALLVSNSIKSVSAANQLNLVPLEDSETSLAAALSSALLTLTSWIPPVTSTDALLDIRLILKIKLVCLMILTSDVQLPSSYREDNANWYVMLGSTPIHLIESVSPVLATAISV